MKLSKQETILLALGFVIGVLVSLHNEALTSSIVNSMLRIIENLLGGGDG